MRPITLALTFALSALWPVQIMAQPLTAVEIHLGEGNDHAMRNEWDESVAAYIEALKDAETSCEKHWAYAGLSAAFAGLSAQSALEAGRRPHPQQGQILRNAFQQQLQDAWGVTRLSGSCG